MTFVIAEPCIGTKDTACVDACPVDCIHPRADEGEFDSATQLYIDPVECIDCGACVPECPVEAIFPEDEVPEEWLGLHQDQRGLLQGGLRTLKFRVPSSGFRDWQCSLRLPGRSRRSSVPSPSRQRRECQ